MSNLTLSTSSFAVLRWSWRQQQQQRRWPTVTSFSISNSSSSSRRRRSRSSVDANSLSQKHTQPLLTRPPCTADCCSLHKIATRRKLHGQAAQKNPNSPSTTSTNTTTTPPNTSDTAHDRGSSGFSLLVNSKHQINVDEELREKIRRLSFKHTAPNAESCILVLATPRFLPLLQQSSGLAASIAAHALQEQRHAASCTLMLGVIDSIPVPDSSRYLSEERHLLNDAQIRNEIRCAEGISISNKFTINEHGQNSEHLPRADRQLELPGTLQVEMLRESHLGSQYSKTLESVALALAWTSMLTGEDHFLVKQTWQRETASEEQIGSLKVKLTQQDWLESATIRLPSPDTNERASGLQLATTGHFSLGPQRQVRSAFGNVIRSLHDTSDSEKALPASAEIESSMPSCRQYFSNVPEVWVLVQPASQERGSSSPHIPEQVERTLEQRLAEGARFFRVSGGGGGWDGPGGPVSLEDDSPVSAVSFADSEELPSFQDLSIVKENDVVQFFAFGLAKQPLRTATANAAQSETNGDHTRPTQHSLKASSAVARFVAVPSPEETQQLPFGLPDELYVVDDYTAALTGSLHFASAAIAGEETADGSQSKQIVTKTRLPPYSVWSV